jgi:hypothetical protein
MEDSIRIAEIVNAGRVPGPDDVRRLAALGISPRQAVLLASMPFQRMRGGLILPSVDDWLPLGHDGRVAREALLNAIHAEARRAIVTPGIGDRATIFDGVWTSRSGKKQFETDLLSVPMQFLGYGMAASNKLLASTLQGRDRSRVMGLFFLIAGGAFLNYMRSDSRSWKERDYDELIFDALETANPSGFWIGDLNSMLERASNNQFGIRPLLGHDPKFESKQGQLDAMVNVLGAGPKMYWDFGRSFIDPSVSDSDAAYFRRKAIPYGNVLWWNRIVRDMHGGLEDSIRGTP